MGMDDPYKLMRWFSVLTLGCIMLLVSSTFIEDVNLEIAPDHQTLENIRYSVNRGCDSLSCQNEAPSFFENQDENSENAEPEMLRVRSLGWGSTSKVLP